MLRIDHFPDPSDTETPITNAYARIFDFIINFPQDAFALVVWIYRTEAAARRVPVAPTPLKFTIKSGDLLNMGDQGDPNALPPVPATLPDRVPAFSQLSELAAAKLEADPNLGPQGAFWHACYEVASKHYAFGPCEVIPPSDPNALV